jgi:hypothetical protein
MLFSGSAGFHGLLSARGRAAKPQKDVIEQALRNKTGDKHHEHSAMLFRTFAVYITFRSTAKTVALTPLRAVYKTPFF